MPKWRWIPLLLTRNSSPFSPFTDSPVIHRPNVWRNTLRQLLDLDHLRWSGPKNPRMLLRDNVRRDRRVRIWGNREQSVSREHAIAAPRKPSGWCNQRRKWDNSGKSKSKAVLLFERLLPGIDDCHELIICTLSLAIAQSDAIASGRDLSYRD